MIAQVKRALAWLAAHPWAIMAALGSLVTMLLFRKRRPGIEPVDVEIATEIERAKVYSEQAKELEPVANALKEQIKIDESAVTSIDEARKEPIEDESDESVAKWFDAHGVTPTRVGSWKRQGR